MWWRKIKKERGIDREEKWVGLGELNEVGMWRLLIRE